MLNVRTLVHLRRFLREEDAATAIEYAMMAALIAAVCVASVGTLSSATETQFVDAADAINGN